MRILFTTTNLDLGGAQMFIMRLAEELYDNGHEVFVYNHQPEWSNREFLSSFSKKIKIISYTDNSFLLSLTWKLNGFLSRLNKNYTFRNWINDRKFKKTLLKYNFDIINSQMYTADRLNAKIAAPLKVPFVITTHGEYELNFSHGNSDFDKEAKHCIDSASAVIYTAEKNIEAIHTLINPKKPLRKILVGFNGDVIKRFNVNPSTLGIKKEDFVIGMVARGIPEKGWNELIEMFLKIKKTYTKRKLHLILIGNGEELKILFKSKKTEDMHLLQFSKNPMEYFSWIAHFDMGVLMSYFKGESVPNAIIEYLYHGLPVLSTPMGDISKMISSPGGMAGELVPLKDGKADVSTAVQILEKWLDDPAYFNKLKENTKAAFEKFKMANVAREYLEVYKDAIANFKQSRDHSS